MHLPASWGGGRDGNDVGIAGGKEEEEAEHMLHQNIHLGIQQGMHKLMKPLGAAAGGALLQQVQQVR